MKRLIDINEASELLHFKKGTIYIYTHRRMIPFIKIGGKLLFDPERLEEWVREREHEPIRTR